MDTRTEDQSPSNEGVMVIAAIYTVGLGALAIAGGVATMLEKEVSKQKGMKR